MEAIPQREVLTVAEFRSALEALQSTDRIRLQKKAAFLAPGSGMEPDDLLQEAVKRSLEENGGRNCPCDVAPMTFLGNVMRSIASHARKEWKRETPSNAGEGDEDNPIGNMPDLALSLEEVVIKRIDCAKMLARIEEMFNKDPKGQAIVIGIMEGWSPQEIREVEPMKENEYVSARKRVRRKLLSEFPKGLTYE